MQIWDDRRLLEDLRWVVVAGFDGNLVALEQVRLVLGGVIVPRRLSPTKVYRQTCPVFAVAVQTTRPRARKLSCHFEPSTCFAFWKNAK